MSLPIPKHVQVARGFIGRPYGHQRDGRHLDCSMLIEELVQAVGVDIKKIDPGSYDGRTLARFLVEGALANLPRIKPAPGALALFRPRESHRADEAHVALVDAGHGGDLVLLHACPVCERVTNVDPLHRPHHEFDWTLVGTVCWPEP